MSKSELQVSCAKESEAILPDKISVNEAFELTIKLFRELQEKHEQCNAKLVEAYKLNEALQGYWDDSVAHLFSVKQCLESAAAWLREGAKGHQWNGNFLKHAELCESAAKAIVFIVFFI